MTSPVIVELPLQFAVVPVQPAVALVERTPAVIPMSPAVSCRLLTVDVVWAVLPDPVVVPLMTPVESATGLTRLAERTVTDRFPPSSGSDPVSPRVAEMTPSTLASTPLARPLYRFPEGVQGMTPCGANPGFRPRLSAATGLSLRSGRSVLAPDSGMTRIRKNAEIARTRVAVKSRRGIDPPPVLSNAMFFEMECRPMVRSGVVLVNSKRDPSLR